MRRYRALMRTLDPGGSPREALKAGWGVERPSSSVVDAVALRIELEPWSHHLFTGGIGSGKTTELWRIYQRLRGVDRPADDDLGDAVHYLDVAAQTRIDRLEPGVLVALAARRLVEFERAVRRGRGGAAPAGIDAAAKAARQLAHGYSVWHPYPDDDDEPWEEEDHNMWRQDIPGVVDSPQRPLGYRLQSMVRHLEVLRDAVTAQEGHCVLLFDSLDRVADPGRLHEVIGDDLRAFARAKLGVVLVGPQRARYLSGEGLLSHFEANVHTIAEVEPVASGLEFLRSVLAARDPDGLLGDAVSEQLAALSGGVLRDLIALAKAAAQEAYAAGAAQVGDEHVAAAADAFGRARAVGLDTADVDALKKIHETNTLVIRGERELALLEKRRVLDYGGGRFAVHPTIVPLLDLTTVAA